MKYLLESSKFNEIHQICQQYGIENYTLNGDGSIDVDGDVDLTNRGLSKLPLKFGIVIVDFYCHNNQLTSLRGAPREVGANFYCSNNRLTSLRGAPEEVGVNFYCYGNQLTSLVGAPRKLGGGFYCSNNPLPQLILDNLGIIEEIIKNQEDYSIWRRDGTLDEFRFWEMMREI